MRDIWKQMIADRFIRFCLIGMAFCSVILVGILIKLYIDVWSKMTF